MYAAWSFPTVSSLLQPCFTSRLWSLWKTSPVRTLTPGLCISSLLAAVGWLALSCLPAALKRAELEECVRWMVPFAMALREVGGSSMKTFTGIPADDVHNIQTHASYMRWLVSSFLLVCYSFPLKWGKKFPFFFSVFEAPSKNFPGSHLQNHWRCWDERACESRFCREKVPVACV